MRASDDSSIVTGRTVAKSSLCSAANAAKGTVYKGRRPHSSLGARTPDTVYFAQAPLLATA
jgi:hypothetical protein